LYINGTGRAYGIGVGNASETTYGVANEFFLFDHNAAAMRLAVDINGNIGIGTTSPVNRLQIAGNVSASSYTSSISNAVGFFGTSSVAVSSSHATTASFALNAGGAGFPFSGSAVITGSLYVSGSNISGSFVGDGSGLTNVNAALNVIESSFVGDGTTTSYSLGASYPAKSLIVTVDGLRFNAPDDFTIVGNNVAFTSAPPSSSTIFVSALINTATNVTGSFSGSFFGNIASASFATSASYVQPSGLPSGVVSASSQISIVADNHAFVGNGTTTIYTLSQSYSPAILTVSIDGLVNTLTEDYTVSTNQLTFVSAPPSSSNILVKGIRIALI
jgi:hypothetical protein